MMYVKNVLEKIDIMGKKAEFYQERFGNEK